MRRNAAHRVHRDGATGNLAVLAAGPIRPRDGQRDRLLEGDFSNLGGDTRNRRSRNPAFGSNCVRRILGRQIALRKQTERRHRLTPVGKRVIADERRSYIRAVGTYESVGLLVEA